MANSPPPRTPEMSLMKQKDSVAGGRHHPRFSRTLSSVLQHYCLEEPFLVLRSSFRAVRWVSCLYQLSGSDLLARADTLRSSTSTEDPVITYSALSPAPRLKVHRPVIYQEHSGQRALSGTKNHIYCLCLKGPFHFCFVIEYPSDGNRNQDKDLPTPTPLDDPPI